MKTLAQRIASLTPEQRKLLEKARRKTEKAAKPRIPKRKGTGPVPATVDQAALWFFQQLDPNTSAFNIGNGMRFRGKLRHDVLERAFNEMVKRHETLRTTYTLIDGRPFQVIHPPHHREVTFFDIRDTPAEELEPLAAAKTSERIVVPFDMEQGPLIRLELIRVKDDEYIMIAVMHHSITDWWSFHLLFRELLAVYTAFKQGKPSPLPDFPIQFADYALWREEWQQSEECQQQLEYWRQKLAGAPSFLNIPSDHPRPPVATHQGAREFFYIPPDKTELVRAVNKRHSATTLMTLLSFSYAFLYRYTGETDILFGSPASADREHEETVNLIGYMLNTIVFRGQLDDDPSLNELMQQVRKTVLDGLANKDLPFRTLVDDINPERDLSRMPIYQVEFFNHSLESPVAMNTEEGNDDSLEAAGLTPVPYGVDRKTSPVDMQFAFTESKISISFFLEYTTDLFVPATVKKMGQLLLNLIDGMLANPDTPISKIEWLSEEQRAELLNQWNEDKHPSAPDQPLHRFIEARAAQTPDVQAVVAPNSEGRAAAAITYGELNARADRVAAHLRSLGVGPESIVGLCTTRSPHLLVGLLATLKAGGCYQPLDPSYPAERLAYMLDDAGAKVLLGETAVKDTLPTDGPPVLHLDALPQEDAPTPAGEPKLTGSNAAYVIYTSGSTGKPKGVVISHGSAVNFLHWLNNRFSDEQCSTVLASTSFSFDISFIELVAPLARGSKIVIIPNLPALPDRLDQELHPTFVNTTPTALGAMLQIRDLPRTVTTLGIGGEPLPANLINRLYAKSHVRDIVNFYGPTETTIYSLCADIKRDFEGAVPLGVNVARTQHYILDAHLEPAPYNVPGEMYLAGDGLARGYHQRPDLTAKAFLPNPYANEEGARMYRTGDLVRRLLDGRVVFFGRVDHQVKLRGFRIETGEIETLLREHPLVDEAIVLVREDSPGDKRLAAYVVTNSDQNEQETIEGLRQHLKSKLPGYMVPAAFMVLPQIPLSPAGKINREALPKPDLKGSKKAYVAPRNALETLLCETWQGSLRVEKVGIQDNFFELGGDSILVIKASVDANGKGLKILPKHIFQYQTVEALAAALDEEDFQAVDAEQEEPIALPPLEHGLVSEEAIERILEEVDDVEDIYPLTPLQEGLLFHGGYDSGRALYIEQINVSIRGKLDAARFKRAWQSVTARHAILRTIFIEDEDEMLQVVLKNPPIVWQEVDSATTNVDQDSLAEQIRNRGFELDVKPPSRFLLVRESETLHHFTWTYHHALLDGWSLPIVFGEVSAFYQADEMEVEAHLRPVRHFRHYLAWHKQQDPAQMEAYWRGQLEDFDTPNALALATPREDVKDNHAVAHHLMSDEATQDLQAFARSNGLTVNTLVQGAWALLTARYSGSNNVVFGVTASGRPPELHGSERMVGLFINTLPLRIHTEPSHTLLPWLRAIQENQVTARQYEYASLADLRAMSGIPAGGTMFESLLVFENYPVDEAMQGGMSEIQVVAGRMKEESNFPLTMLALPGKQMVLKLSYQPKLFADGVASGLPHRLAHLLAEMIRAPQSAIGTRSHLDDSEKSGLLYKWNDTAADYPRDSAIHSLFETRAAQHPGEPALLQEDAVLSYGALNEAANRLSGYLRSRGVKQGDAVCFHHVGGMEAIITILAIVKAGGAYVPLNPDFPAERLKFMIEDTGAKILLATPDVAEHFKTMAIAHNLAVLSPSEDELSGRSGDNNSVAVHPLTPAYIMYTSGSTGTPKGVTVTHRNVIRLVEGQTYVTIGREDVMLQAGPLGFDASTLEVWGSLLNGARLALKTTETPDRLPELILRYKVSVMFLTAQLFHTLIEEHGDTLAGVKQLIVGGDAISPAHARAFLEREQTGKLINGYGPTESTTFAITCDLTPYKGTRIPIGKPLANTTAFLVDPHGYPTANGVAGDLFLGGDGLAAGYVGKPDLTAERFVPNPFAQTEQEAGGRLYDTGDRATRAEDGEILFNGRRDMQVKLRGFRIELGEIEHCLHAAPNVKDAVVMVETVADEDKRLVAHIIPEQTLPDEPAERKAAEEALAGSTRGYLAERLPAYMVPSAILCSTAFPLKSTGKVDRQALSRLAAARYAERAYVAPATEMEKMVADTWQAVLGIERVGMEDNFFELGGNSLSATRIITRMRNTTNFDIPIATLFEHPMAKAFAEYIEIHEWVQKPQNGDASDEEEFGEV